MKLSIIIPCYNEAKNIPLILQHFDSEIKDNNVEVILINNGSKDNSATVLKETLPKYPFARSVNVDINQGYGFGILAGLKEGKGDFLGWTHADMQTDPADVIKGWKMILSATDSKNTYIKGNRKGRSLFDNFFTVGMSFFEFLILGKPLWDINAQPNIFHRDFFNTWDNPPFDFSLDLYAFYTAKKKKLNVIRFPVFFPERIHGTSSWNTGLAAKWKFIKRTLHFSLTLKKRLKP